MHYLMNKDVFHRVISKFKKSSLEFAYFKNNSKLLECWSTLNIQMNEKLSTRVKQFGLIINLKP